MHKGHNRNFEIILLHKFAFQFIFSNQCALIKTYVCQSIDLSRLGKFFIIPVDIRPIFKLFRYDRCPPLTGSFRSQYVFYWGRSSRENVIGNREFYALKAEENSFCAENDDCFNGSKRNRDFPRLQTFQRVKSKFVFKSQLQQKFILN